MDDESAIDFEVFAANYLKIMTKEGELLPLLLNNYQRELWHLICRQRDAGLPVRIIILKARQMGISTFCAAYLYWLTSLNRYTSSKIIAHDDESTNNIFNIFKRYYEMTPLDPKPLVRYSNRKELVFENPDDRTRANNPGLLSHLAISTAGARERAGRSSTIHHLHISEHAFWPGATLSTPALISAVSNSSQSTIIIESTANGMVGDGEDYYQRVQKAQKQLSDFSFFFIPWVDNKKYVKTYPGFDFDPKERELQNLYQLSNEQIAWRRYTIENVFNGDELLFRQEFPISPDEAFIVSGTPYFDTEHVIRLIKKLEDDPVTPKQDNLVTIYEEPKPNEIYIIGADVAEGLQHGDSSAAFVMDRDMKQVAKIHCKIDPDLFGKELVSLAIKYNNAIICSEVNNMGHATLAEIKRLNYPNVYWREVYDEITQKRMKKLGWNTTAQNKLTMLAQFKAAFRAKDITICDIDLLREMLTVSMETASKVELNGKDRVVSACLAVQAMTQAPDRLLYRAKIPSSNWKKPVSSFEELTRVKRNQPVFLN